MERGSEEAWHRSYLAMMGILAVGFGLIISLGLTMFFGFPYTPIHGILPFLALGRVQYGRGRTSMGGQYFLIPIYP